LYQCNYFTYRWLYEVARFGKEQPWELPALRTPYQVSVLTQIRQQTARDPHVTRLAASGLLMVVNLKIKKKKGSEF